MNKIKKCINCKGCALFRLFKKDESKDCKYYKPKGDKQTKEVKE